MKRAFRCGDQTVTLDIERASDTLQVRLPDGAEHTVQARRLPNGDIEIAEGERVLRVPVAAGAGGSILLAWQGAAYAFLPVTDAEIGGRAGARPRSGLLMAPMVGVIADLTVGVGDHVDAYQPVVVVEAMKVLAALEAPFSGVIAAVHVRKGDRVEHGAPLVEIAPDPVAAEEPASQ